MKRFRCLVASMLVGSGVSFGAQGEVEIVHDPIECWPVDQFLLIQSSFVPPEDIQTAKFYFRSTAHSDYYYVELSLGPGGARAIAPKAEPATPGVTYYLELVTRGYSAFRTEERDVPVATGAECKRRDPETAFYTGQSPDIAVGATRVGATPLPPGFQADGISRFLNATGIAGEAGTGGVSGKTVGIIGGIGGAGAAFLLLGGGSDATTTGAVGGITTSSPSSSSTSTTIGGVTSTTTTAGGGGPTTSSTTTTVAGGPTTTTIAGGPTTTPTTGPTTTPSTGPSTTPTTGPSTTPTTSPSTTPSTSPSTTPSTSPSTTPSTSASTTPSTSPSTTPSTSPSTTPSTSPSTAPAGADLRVSKRDGQDPVRVGSTVAYSITVTNAGPAVARSAGFIDTLPSSMVLISWSGASCGASGSEVTCSMGDLAVGSRVVTLSVAASAVGVFTNRVTVGSSTPDPNTGNNSTSETTSVTATLRTGDPARVTLTFNSTLAIEPAGHSTRGRVIVNGSTLQQTDNSGAYVYTLEATPGLNHLEAFVDSSTNVEGSWRFDFTGSAQFEPGSLRVESGHVISFDGRSVVFAISGASAAIRFSLQLSDREPRSRKE